MASQRTPESTWVVLIPGMGVPIFVYRSGSTYTLRTGPDISRAKQFNSAEHAVSWMGRRGVPVYEDPDNWCVVPLVEALMGQV